MRIRVNPIRCEAHGLCAELLPEWVAPRRLGIPDPWRTGSSTRARRSRAPRRRRLPDARAAARACARVRQFLAALTASALLVAACGGASTATHTSRRRSASAPVSTRRPASRDAARPAALSATTPQRDRFAADEVRPGRPVARPDGRLDRALAVRCRSLSFDQQLVVLVLHSGTVDAGTVGWRYGPTIAGRERGHLVARSTAGSSSTPERAGLSPTAAPDRRYAPGSARSSRTSTATRTSVPGAGAAGARPRRGLGPPEPDAADRPWRDRPDRDALPAGEQRSAASVTRPAPG